MTDTITLTGLVATPPRHLLTSARLPITSFRLASNQRRFDRATNSWVDIDTNWYTVTAFRQLALNSVSSVHKGDRVVVTGRLRIREWENGERKGTSIEIEADAIGHDLRWGTASYLRSTGASSQPQEDYHDDSTNDDAVPSYGSQDSPADSSPRPFDPDEGSHTEATRDTAATYSAPLLA